MSTRRRWSLWKQLVMYPVILAIVGEAFSIAAVVIDMVSPPRVIEGRPDTGPNAGLMLGLIIPVLLAAYLAMIGVVRLLVMAATNGFDSKE